MINFRYFRLISALALVLLSTLLNFSSAEDLMSSIARKQPDSELSILGITIGKTTMDEVKAKFKSKGIYHEGESGSNLYVLCYKTPNGSTIAFESGELGGDTHIVSCISINAPKTPYRMNKVCEKTSLIKTKLAINGLSLGMSPELIKRLKGKPSKQTTDSLLYQYEVQEKTEKGQLDTKSSLRIDFKQDYATEISASKVETFFAQ